MRHATAVAPGRVNLIGEHTDYNGGRCLPFAIPLTTTAVVAERGDGALVVRSDQGDPWTGRLDDVAARAVTGWAAYVAGVVWALDVDGTQVGGLDIEVTSTIPLGGGLSSSAALECAVAVALHDLLGHHLDDDARRRLAEACRRAETEYVGAPTGGVDQLASLLATDGHAVHIDFAVPDRPATGLVPLPLDGAGLTVLVTDTGVRHSLADGDGGYAQRRAEAAAGDPRRRRHVATENQRVEDAVAALGSSDWQALGTLLTASHLSLRDDYEVSCRELDVTVEAALAAGALGARMTGGGFGGCAIALIDAVRADDVSAAIDEAYRRADWPRPTHHHVTASAGARLVRPAAQPPE